MILPYLALWFVIFLITAILSFVLSNNYLLLIGGFLLIVMGVFVISGGIEMSTSTNITEVGDTFIVEKNYEQIDESSSTYISIILMLIGLLIIMFSLFGGL